ncbi:mannose-1-phosphate guanylyltransferase [Fodinibius halophilus]|uniref:mannose-1-phosphate guanylyltransferase n=1 Tax=Fodinibius halophilus TaxID=1736908 RepID=A0A6M1T9X6_9BACT|nr:mannose-1-phosphate guanylyltransferase [Fodinibius halophilus]NGP87172.1 mannose-1-phosphate guanylyltransferase [Fodinibius halophilus]
MLHAVVMAGGSGTRFWPRSTEQHPKQFLNIFGDRTMLQSTVERIEALVPAERVWVITNDKYVDLVQKQLPDLPTENIVGEPVGRNTAPCVAAAATLIEDRDPEATMVVLPADHLISDTDTFLSILKSAESKAADSNALVTIGIKPDRPETGYGYVEYDEEHSESHGDHEVKKVAQFREKPDRETAEQFIKAGNFLWNSGMFVWQASTILEEFSEHLPEINQEIEKLRSSLTTGSQKDAVDKFYHACPSISIDYGIMERSKSVFVVPGSFGWNDVGSWRAVYDLRSKDENGNVIETDHATFAHSKNNLIHSNSDKMIALIGVENIAVVETDTAIMVCNLDDSQGIKDVVNYMRKNDHLKKFV